MLPNIGQIVWLGGDRPALVLGHVVDDANIANGDVVVVELPSPTVIGPNDDGAYDFGENPYDAAAQPGTDDRGVSRANPGGFNETSPVVANAATSSSNGAPVDTAAPGATVGDPVPVTTSTTDDVTATNAPAGAPADAAVDPATVPAPATSVDETAAPATSETTTGDVTTTPASA